MTDYGINIVECYDIDYANPALFGERTLGSPILMGNQNAQLFKKIGHTHNFFPLCIYDIVRRRFNYYKLPAV